MEDAREDVCDAPSSGQSHGKQVNAFFEILEQMQVLQGRLRDAYETDLAIAKPKSKMAIPAPRTPRNGSLEDAQVRPPQNPTLSVLNLPESASILADDFDNAAGPVVGQRSIPVSAESRQNSLSPRSTKMSNKLMKRAREATANMEEELDADSLESALQLREEWNLPEERLKELKRLQRRMSVGSIALKPTQPKRQYLLHTEMSEAPIFVTHPNSWKRSCWDCLAVIAILFEISVAPLLLYRMDDSARRVADSLQWITTIFWVFDIPATFFTATYVNDILCFRLGEIARAYLRSWFLFDVLMLVPDLIVVLLPDMADGPAGVFRMARARRVLRLFRFVQIVRLWKTLQAFMSSLETRLTFLRTQFGSVARPVFLMGLLMAVAVHMLGSLWFAVGDSPRGWVTEEGLHEQPLTRQYTRSLEWALSKLPPSSLRLTVDLNTPLERWLGISATCGMLISGSIFVSFVTNTMADVARERTRTTKMIESVRKYCAIHSISYSYTMQMKRYVQQEHRRNEMQGHMPFLQHLPEGMIRELFQEARSPILHRHAFFREIGRSDPSMELNLCSQAVFELYHLPGDIIFDTTSKTRGMYFIASGFSVYFHWSDSPKHPRSACRGSGNIFSKLLGVQRGSDVPMTQTMLELGEYAAEPAVWVNTWRHQGHLQAMVQGRSLLVSTEDLFKVLQGYANALANSVVYARCFVKELNRRAQLCGQVTDLPLPLMKGGSEEDLIFQNRKVQVRGPSMLTPKVQPVMPN